MNKKINLNNNKISYYYNLLLHEDLRNQFFKLENSYKKDGLIKDYTILTKEVMSIRDVKSFRIGAVNIKKTPHLVDSISSIKYSKQNSKDTVIFSPFYFEDAVGESLFSPIYFVLTDNGNEVSYVAKLNKFVDVFKPGMVDEFNSNKNDDFVAKNLNEMINIVKILVGEDYLKKLGNTKTTNREVVEPTISIEFKNEFVFVVKSNDKLENKMLAGLLGFYKEKLVNNDVVDGSVLDLILKQNHYGYASDLYITNSGPASDLTMSKEKFIDLNKKHLGSLSGDFPLAESQRFSLLATNSDLKIVPVNGPPGTGKTALLKNVFANHMVKEVLGIKDQFLTCRENDTTVNCFKPILGTSSVNQAIINIIDGINDSFKEADIHRLIDFPTLNIEGASFNVNDYFVPLLGVGGQGVINDKVLKISLRNIYNYILSLDPVEINKSYINNYNSKYGTDHKDIYQITDDLYAKIELNNKSMTSKLEGLTVKGPSIQENIDSAKNSLEKINEAVSGLEKKVKSIEWLRRLFTKNSFSLEQNNSASTNPYHVRSGKSVADFKDEALRVTLEIKNLNDELIKSLKDDELSSDDLKVTSELDNKERFLNFEYSFHILEAIFIHNLIVKHDPVCLKCGGAIVETDKWFHCEERGSFHWASKKWGGDCDFGVKKEKIVSGGEPFVIDHDEFSLLLRAGYLYKDSRCLSLNFWKEKDTYITSVKDKHKSEFTLDNINLITPLFPLVVSTLHSLYGNFSSDTDESLNYPFEFFDLTLTDESGMILPSLAMPAAHITKKIVIVGDEKQIEPVFTLDNETERLFFDKSFVDVVADIKANHEKPLSIIDRLHGSVSFPSNTFMSMANNATFVEHSLMSKGECESKELWLREHFRCKDTIIKYCNYIIYKDILKPRVFDIRKEHKLPFYGSAIFKDIDLIDVDTVKNKNSSTLECNTIIKHIKDNFDLLIETYKGEPIEKIVGIVTPFNNQADLIKKELKKDSRLKNITVGTVHKFQGSERGVMYFSPVVCSINDADHFINRDDGNMMNVAVSRAKDSFIVVGSKVGMSRVGGYTEKYVKYIEEEIYLKDVSEIT